MLGSMKIELDNMIADLNEKRLYYEDMLKEVQKRQTELEEKTVLLDLSISEAEGKKRETLSKAYKESSEIISDAKRQMHALLEEIKNKDKELIRKTIKQVETRQEYITEKIREYDVEDLGGPLIDNIKKGDPVFVRSLGYDAIVVDVNPKNNRIKIASNYMEVEVPLTDIGFKKGKPLPPQTDTVHSTKDAASVSTKIHLVGKRVDEALSELEQFLNHASLADMRELVIIHGVGKGLLRRAIHEHMTDHPLVRKFRSGTIEEGGIGVTLVTLK
jgi:DNA mismatch repair protein MutS2